MMMEDIGSLKIKCIIHKEITDELLNEIISIKQQYWEYSTDEQIKWISKNINDDDIHLMIFSKDNALIAYLNLVNVKIMIDNKIYAILGIGNVCVDTNYIGRSMGKLLMNVCNIYLKNMNKTGILLCKDKLVPFYVKAGWIKYNNQVIINNDTFNANVFLSDMRFTNCSRIIIDKYF